MSPGMPYFINYIYIHAYHGRTFVAFVCNDWQRFAQPYATTWKPIPDSRASSSFHLPPPPGSVPGHSSRKNETRFSASSRTSSSCNVQLKENIALECNISKVNVTLVGGSCGRDVVWSGWCAVIDLFCVGCQELGGFVGTKSCLCG